MLQVWIGAILLVLGMFMLLANPVAGGILIAIGYALYINTSKATRAAAESTFWGICLICMIVVGAVAFLGLF
nr:hypothetical protein [uncultured Pseudomonas sp.]